MQVETEELVQGQGWDEIQICSVLIQGLTHDGVRRSHPDPFFSILQLGGLFLWLSLPFRTTFWGATSFVARPERRWLGGEVRRQRRWLGSRLAELQPLSPAVAGTRCFGGIEKKPTAGSYEVAYPWESFL